MGYVFRAEHTMIGRDYALKILAPEQLNEVSWKRFESEGRAIAALDHPNIVKVYNMGIDAGDCPFYVMDLLQGYTLAEALRAARKPDFYQYIDIFSQIARGLSYAHSKGIIHRDVKPSNVVLEPDERGYLQVRLVDFGIAKLLKDTGGKDQRLTAAGQVFGTPFYMSPEQCLGEDVDQRSDIYSLGCALFETLAGDPPFCGSNAMETVMLHLSGPIPELGDVLPNQLAQRSVQILLNRMLAKKAQDRYASMIEVTHDLERIREGKEIGRATTASSRQAPVEDEEAEDEEDAAGGAKAGFPIKWLVALIVAAIFLAGIVAVITFIKGASVTRGDSAMGIDNSIAAVAPTAPGLSREEQRESALNEVDEGPLKEAQKAFAKVNLIYASLAGREKIVHFPDYPIGWIVGRNHNLPARGDVILPLNDPVVLSVDWHHDATTRAEPGIFTKIVPDLIDDLAICSSGNERIMFAEGNGGEDRCLRELLHTASTWTHLHWLRLRSFQRGSIDEKVMKELDKFKYLDGMQLRGGQLDAGLAARHTFLQQLTTIDLEKTVNIDALLAVLGKSKKLVFLHMDRTNPSAAGLKHLVGCTKLKALSIAEYPLTTEGALAISQIASLENVSIGDLPAAEIEKIAGILSKSKRLHEVDINASRLSPDQQRRLMKQYPKLKLISVRAGAAPEF